jgi:hypothetical protein
MIPNEREIYISADGAGRAAIGERDDGCFCLYVHWIWPEPGGRMSWIGDATPKPILYADKALLPGIYGSVEDARRELRALPGFGCARLLIPGQPDG